MGRKDQGISRSQVVVQGRAQNHCSHLGINGTVSNNLLLNILLEQKPVTSRWKHICHCSSPRKELDTQKLYLYIKPL